MVSSGTEACLEYFAQEKQERAARSAKGRQHRRVLVVSPQPFFELRGTPINVLQMIRALCAAGYEVHLASYGIGTPVEMDGLIHHRAITPPGIRAVRIGFSPQKMVLDALLALTVARLLLTHRFDVAHAIEESVFFTLPLARARGVPVIYDLDSSLPDQLEYSGAVRSRALLQLVRSAEAAALRGSELAITVCQALTDSVHRAAPGVQVLQIEDAPLAESLRSPDAAVVRQLRERYGAGPFVVYTGNLAGYQGIDLLLDAAGHLARSSPLARVLIVGGEPAEIAAVQLRLQRSGLDRTVVFAGKQPPELMAEFMALGTVLVSPRREGANTPLKLYTYMYSGTPLVATDIASHRQVLDDSTAVLCAPEPEALASALARVLADPGEFAGRAAAARAVVSEKYSPQVFARKLLGGYRDLLARSSRKS